MANVDLKSLFTSEKQYTVLQLLNVLIDEVGKSMVKTATINQDVSAGMLTITVILSDDSVVTASTKLNSLTDTEKSLISTLQSQVTANSDGITFTKFVGFEGNETHKGNEIHQGYSSFLGDENHAGTETHKGSETHSGEVSFSNTITSTSIVKADEIDNSSGNAMLRYKLTENKVVLGGSTKPTVIMGSTTRPYYSNSGSDFTGVELALKSDISGSTGTNIGCVTMYTPTITYSETEIKVDTVEFKGYDFTMDNVLKRYPIICNFINEGNFVSTTKFYASIDIQRTELTLIGSVPSYQFCKVLVDTTNKTIQFVAKADWDIAIVMTNLDNSNTGMIIPWGQQEYYRTFTYTN